MAQSGPFQGLEHTAGSLIQAIESVPGAGRVAVFVQDARTPLRFLSGPSFRGDEVEALSGLIAALAGGSAPDRPAGAAMPTGQDPASRVRLFPLRVPSERPAAILVTVRDPEDDGHPVFDGFMDQIVQLAGIVVEDRRLRSKLTEQQSLLEALVGAAPDAIIRLGGDGTIFDFMGSAPRIFGWTAGEIVGQSLSALLPEPDGDAQDDAVAAFLATEGSSPSAPGRRLEARHRCGRAFPIEVSLSPLPGSGAREYIAIVRDITLRVERERELDAMREALDAAVLQSALGELAATIAHELNQPLTAIANYMDALELRLELPDEANLKLARDLAGRAAAQARLGAEIIRRTRRMALYNESEPAMGDFHAVVAEALSIIAKAPAALGVTIRHRIEGGAAPALFDKVQLQQVLINLVSNALRAMRHAQIRVLTVTSRQDNGRLELVVADTGPGVPPEDRAKIFDRFFRRSASGMGLGLSVVARIARAHGGDIRVSDGAEGGAEFTLTLPHRVL